MATQSHNRKLFAIVTLVLIIIAVGTYAYGYLSKQTSTATTQLRSLADQGTYTTLIDETADGANPSRPSEIDSYETKSKALESADTTATGGITPTKFGNSTHPEGTQNSPYTPGVDGYSYTDPQDYEN